MLFAARPRIVTFLSALGTEEKNATLVNLCTGLGQLGQDVVLLEARLQNAGPSRWLGQNLPLSLVDVAQQRCTMQQALVPTPHGIKLASLCRYQNGTANFPANHALLTKLNQTVVKLGNTVDIVLADGELTDTDRLAASTLEEGEIVIQVTNRPDSIKTAYSLIKRAHAKMGRREYGLLVTGVNEFDAHRVYDAMAQAAGSFLSVPINFFGYVPQDDCLRHATRSGKSVIDAYPQAGTSMAFSRLARHMTGSSDYALST